MLVGEYLNLDMARMFEVALDQNPIVAEGSLGLSPAGFESLCKILGRAHDPHSLAPTARGGLDHDGIPDFFGCLGESGQSLIVPVISRDQWDSRIPHQILGSRLGAHDANRLARGADEHNASLAAGFGEFGVLGEESVSRVDCLGTRALGHFYDSIGAQIAVARG